MYLESPFLPYVIIVLLRTCSFAEGEHRVMTVIISIPTFSQLVARPSFAGLQTICHLTGKLPFQGYVAMKRSPYICSGFQYTTISCATALIYIPTVFSKMRAHVQHKRRRQFVGKQIAYVGCFQKSPNNWLSLTFACVICTIRIQNNIDINY
jgi:hypothetical protein